MNQWWSKQLDSFGNKLQSVKFERKYGSTQKLPVKMSSAIRRPYLFWPQYHYNDVTMGAIASQITSITIVYSTVYWNADQEKYQSSASLAFVWGIHRWPVNSSHKWPVTRNMFPFDDVIMTSKHSHKFTGPESCHYYVCRCPRITKYVLKLCLQDPVHFKVM